MPPVRTQTSCPQCRALVATTLEQLFDVNQDPAARSRFLSGRFNLIQCPNCGFQGQVATPLMYHDPDKEMLISFVPMELGLPQAEQERIIGRMMNEVLGKLPQEKRKGYLLNPKPALTLQGMMDRVLEAEGVTREMLEAQRAKAQLLQRLLTTPDDQLPAVVQENDASLDTEFFQLLAAAAQAQASGQAGRAGVERLAALQQRLIELSSFGQRLRRRQQALEAAAAELDALGDQLSPDRLMELILQARADEEKVEAYVSLVRPALDYAFFEALTRRVDRAQGGDKDQLAALRDRLLALTQQIDRAAQAQMETASQVLRALLEAPDLGQALRDSLPAIDETFMAVLNLNLEAARRAKRQDVVQRLQQIEAAIAQMVQEASPPEVRFVNDLLQIDGEDVALAVLKKRSAEITQALVDAMGYIAENLRQNDQPAMADRLERLRDAALGELMAANWRK